MVLHTGQVPGCSMATQTPPTLEKVLTAHTVPGSLKVGWGWWIFPVQRKLAEWWVSRLGDRSKPRGWAQAWPEHCWLTTLSLHALMQVQNNLQTWADKLALYTDRCLPGAGGNKEQMSMEQLAKLPQAAPGQTDARLPHGGICSGCSALQGRSPSCSLLLIPVPFWLLLHAGLPTGAKSTCSLWVALSCQLETGAEWGGGQAQPPQQLPPHAAAITSCLHPD